MGPFCQLAAVRSASVALFACALVGAAPAFAQAPAKAPTPKAPAPGAAPSARSFADTLPPDLRNEYAAGKILYEDHDYATALVKFQDIYDKARDARLLWNIAACFKNMRHYARALDALRQYVATGEKLSPQELQDARDVIGAIEPFTTSVTFRVNEPDAELSLDDEVLGTTPVMRPVVVDIGTRRVRLKKEGFRTVDRDVPIGGAKDATVDLVIERSGGHLELTVPPDASVIVDDKPAGQGPIVKLDLSVGGHALRITAPKAHAYQGDVTIEDGQTRVLAIKLEQDAEQISELRVAVGCRDPGVRIPNEGLTVYLDGSTISASPLGVRMRATDSGEVPAYVPYTVSPGVHRAVVRFPSCEPLTAETTAPPQQAGTIEGVLPPLNRFLNGSPAGSPNGPRVSVGFAQTSVRFNDFQSFLVPGAAASTPPSTVGMAGLSASFALEGRWTVLALDPRYVWGWTTGSAESVSEAPPRPAFTTTSAKASMSQVDTTLRAGFRVPLYYAALAFGPEGHAGRFATSPSVGGKSFEGGGGFWGALDAQPLCDFGLSVGGGYAWVGYSHSPDVGAQWASSFFVHATFQPNTICDRRQAGMYQLRGQ
jgi:hypothetical protein